MNPRIYTPRDPRDLAALEALEARFGPVKYRPRSGFKLSGGALFVKYSQARGGSGMAHGSAKGTQGQCLWCGRVGTVGRLFMHSLGCATQAAVPA